MKTLSASLLLFCILCPFVLAQGMEASSFAMIKRVTNLPSNPGTVTLELDDEVARIAKPDRSDVVIFENQQPASFSILFDRGSKISTQATVAASSTLAPAFGTDYGAQHIIDGILEHRPGGYWQNDPSLEQSTSRITLDFSTPTYATEVIIHSRDPAFRPTSASIMAGTTINSLQTIKFISTSSTQFSTITATAPGIMISTTYSDLGAISVRFSPTLLRFMVLELQGPAGIAIDEIEVFGAPHDTVVLYADPSKTYTLAYANPDATPTNFSSPLLTLDSRTPSASLGPGQTNPLYNPDPDHDSIPAQNDNCRKTPNPDQKNSDTDTIGDACDNCKKTSNQDQSDTDNDGIGNACDNCPSTANIDQRDANLNSIGDACEDPDRDGVMTIEDNCPTITNPRTYFDSHYIQSDVDMDGIGDACDSSDGRYSEHKTYLYAGFLIGFLILAWLAYDLWNKGSTPAKK